MSERVLLIDDEEDFIEILSERLTNREMDVIKTTSAKDGYNKALQEEFDAIVLDLKMPEMDGIETLEKIMAKNPDMQVIILTGHATLDKGVKAMKLGAIDVIEKPVKIDQLVEKIRTAQANKMLIYQNKLSDRLKNIMESKGW